MKLTNILLIIIAICLVVMIINPRPIEIKIAKLPEIKIGLEHLSSGGLDRLQRKYRQE